MGVHMGPEGPSIQTEKNSSFANILKNVRQYQKCKS